MDPSRERETLTALRARHCAGEDVQEEATRLAARLELARHEAVERRALRGEVQLLRLYRTLLEALGDGEDAT